jgi:hypothetical protein
MLPPFGAHKGEMGQREDGEEHSEAFVNPFRRFPFFPLPFAVAPHTPCFPAIAKTAFSGRLRRKLVRFAGNRLMGIEIGQNILPHPLD